MFTSRTVQPKMFQQLLLWFAATLLVTAIAAAQAEALRYPTLPSQAPAGTGMTVPCLPEAPVQIRCGRFRVLENRSEPDGATLDLAFMVADSDAVNPGSDAVTFFLGGPGSSATRSARGLIGVFRSLLKERDLLFLDFRGVGESSALSCEDPYPRGVVSRMNELFPLDHALACAERLSKRTRLDQYTTDASMDDLNELRAWLNYSQLNVYAGSYGSRELQVLLRRHPEVVRTAVLIAVSPLSHKSYLSHARSLQDALDALVTECEADGPCSAHYPDLAGQLTRVLAEANQEPPLVIVDGQRLSFGPGALGYAIRGLLYRQGHEVPFYIDQAAQGNWQPFADYYLQRQAWVAEVGGETGYHWSVVCAESIQFITDEEVAQQTNDTFLGSYLVDAYRSVCEQWPHADLPQSFLEPAESAIPTLILSGERDPVTPVSKGDAVAQFLENSRHIVVPNGGHGVWAPCYLRMIEQLIRTESIDGFDTSCVAATGKTDFKPPSA